MLNAGVSGYGFDQIVLRAEELAPLYKPAAIVVALHRRRHPPHRDAPAVGRRQALLRHRRATSWCCATCRCRRAPTRRTTLNFWQRTLGYSFLVDFILRRLDLLHDWFGDHIRVHPPGTGERIACLLTARLAELQRASGARVLVVAEYDPVVWDDPAFAAKQRR